MEETVAQILILVLGFVILENKCLKKLIKAIIKIE